MRDGIGRRSTAAAVATALGVGLALAGCTHIRNGPVSQHYRDFGAQEPQFNTVYVCHSYGCRMQTRFRFTDEDLQQIRIVMERARKADTPAEERRAVAYAIGWMETRTGEVIGTKADRPGMDFMASGDPTQQDCVDEATNTSSYLLVLERNGLLKHHTVGTPFAKENYLRGVSGWTHWTAVLKENAAGQKWAVDSWIYANGENPAVVEVEKWYIASLNQLPSATH
ncbi:MAG: hypothetical protein NW223_07355 [Hyphomicrobiaceae bacterium]|nr:hypothetical protein [Hyphomicrobiaceae bacterium]